MLPFGPQSSPTLRNKVRNIGRKRLPIQVETVGNSEWYPLCMWNVELREWMPHLCSDNHQHSLKMSLAKQDECIGCVDTKSST